jgi:hypothetical protein
MTTPHPFALAWLPSPLSRRIGERLVALFPNKRIVGSIGDLGVDHATTSHKGTLLR